MTAYISVEPTPSAGTLRPAEVGRPRTPGRRARERGSSPQVGERVRPLSRGQVEDRVQELGDLFAEVSGGGPWAWNQARAAFLRHLAADARRPGFSLLIAETTTLTGCAYGFPVCGPGPWWEGYDGPLPGSVLSRAAAGRLFVVSGIVVPPRVRQEYQNRAWNLARRLQRRLLADHGAALGITLVDRRDRATVAVLRSWGWRNPVDDVPPPSPAVPYRILLLTAGT
ncbi:hypothetical protein ACWC10_30640 [Streptomyces sp. NPDC001595]|uniref:hypothetical protein n=1 Tax=Streptomyces sp. NPDC001532 TaxID=3154520 RepID=UPI003327540E